MPFQSSNSNIQVNEEVVSRITAITAGNIPTFNAAGKMIDSGIPAASGSLITRYQFAPLSATASIQPFLKTIGTGSLPSQVASGLTAGIVTDPYIIHSNCTIRSIRMTIGGGCVQQATVGASPTARIDIYKMNNTSRTLIATYRITFVAGTIGVFTTPALSFQTAILSGLSDALTAGDVIGAEFVQENTDNNKLNGIINGSFVLETIG